MRAILLSMSVFLVALSCTAVGQEKTVPSHASNPIRIEMEAPDVKAAKGAAVVDDAQASGGKALKIIGEGKKSLSDEMDVAFSRLAAPGFYRLRARMRVEDVDELGQNWRVEVLSHKGGEVLGYGVAQGYYFRKGRGYTDFDIPFEIMDISRAPVVRMHWGRKNGNPWPRMRERGKSDEPVARGAIYLDYLEISKTGDAPPIRVLKVWPNKLRYTRGEDGTADVILLNPWEQPVQGEVRLELYHDLDPRENLGRAGVELEPGETRKITMPLRHGRDAAADFGYEVRATAVVDGKEVDSNREFFCVADNPGAVSTHFDRWYPAMDEPRNVEDYYNANMWPGVIRKLSAGTEQRKAAALEMRENYVTVYDTWVWSPGGCIDLTPEADVFSCSYGTYVYGKRQMTEEVAFLGEQGIAVFCYLVNYAGGLEAVELMRRKPEWFQTFSNGDFGRGYSIEAIDNQRKFYALPTLKEKLAFARNLGTVWFDLDFSKPELIDYIADQIIAGTDEFGFCGIRWDCGHLQTSASWTWKPGLDFFGKPVCTTYKESDMQTAENIRRLKERVRKKYPNFGVGTNYGNIIETSRTPIQVRELCKDGGWIQDEPCMLFPQPDSPYRFWDKYYKYFSDQAEHIMSQGGHYVPLTRSLYGSSADHLYSTVFQLAGHGHSNYIYRNPTFVTGDPAQFIIRYGRFFFDNAFRKVRDPESTIKVRADSPLWWKESVWRKIEKNRRTLVLHLINPPVSKAWQENPSGKLRDPVQDISVSVKLPEGCRRAKAWLLTCESWRFAEPAVTADMPLDVGIEGDNAEITVPEILVWKTLVWQFE